MESLGTILALLFTAVVILVTIAVLVRLLLKRRKAKQEKAREDQHIAQNHDPFIKQTTGIDPFEMRNGDLIEYLGTTYRVRGRLHLMEDGYVWREFWLDSTNSKIWLSVERDPDLEVIEWTEVEVENLIPGARKLIYNGATYRLDEKGFASYSSSGSTGLPSQGTVEYFDYVNEEASELANWLSFERFDDGDWEAATGMALFEGVYQIYRPSASARP